LITIKLTLWKKFLDPYIVNDPKCWNQLWSGNWVKTKFFFIFPIFGRDTTNYRDTLVENVKKVKNQPTLLNSIQYMRGNFCDCPLSSQNLYFDVSLKWLKFWALYTYRFAMPSSEIWEFISTLQKLLGKDVYGKIMQNSNFLVTILCHWNTGHLVHCTAKYPYSNICNIIVKVYPFCQPVTFAKILEQRPLIIFLKLFYHSTVYCTHDFDSLFWTLIAMLSVWAPSWFTGW
jgi:hypothetical protein